MNQKKTVFLRKFDRFSLANISEIITHGKKMSLNILTVNIINFNLIKSIFFRTAHRFQIITKKSQRKRNLSNYFFFVFLLPLHIPEDKNVPFNPFIDWTRRKYKVMKN